MKTTNIFFLATIVFLLSVFMEGCSSDSINLVPEITNEFEVNLINTNPSLQSFRDVSSLIVDEDTLEFGLISYSNLNNTSIIKINTNTAGFESLAVLQYPKNRFLNTVDSNGLGGISGVVDSGIFIDSTNLYWIPFFESTTTDKLYSGGGPIYQSSDVSPAIYSGATFGRNQYVVFRKRKGDNYLYYWVRVVSQYGDFFPEEIAVFNGKYQLNSITTGQ